MDLTLGLSAVVAFGGDVISTALQDVNVVAALQLALCITIFSAVRWSYYALFVQQTFTSLLHRVQPQASVDPLTWVSMDEWDATQPILAA